MNQGYRWWLAIRQAPDLRKKVPLEAVASYPVGGPNEVRIFYYRVISGKLIRPFVRVRVSVDQQNTIKVVEIRQRQQSETDLFPGLPLDLGTAPEGNWSKAVEETLLEQLPTLLERFPARSAGKEGILYLHGLARLTPEALLPFYHALNPEFFAWLQA